MRSLFSFVLLIGLAAYVVAFYATPMPIFPTRDKANLPLDRMTTIVEVARDPGHWLFSYWFGDPPQFALADRWPVLLTAGLVVAWAAVVGWLLMVLLRWLCSSGVSPAPNGATPAPVKAARMPAPPGDWLPAPQLTRLETGIFALAIGLSALSTWTLLLGLAGLLERQWIFIAPAIITLLAAAGVLYRRQQKGLNRWRLTAAGLAAAPPTTASRHPPPLRSGGGAVDHFFSKQWLWLGLPFVLAILLASMLPPVDFDVCEYHLQAPKEFFQQGKITFLPHNVYANMTLGAEMLSLLAMTIARDWWWGALAGKTVIAVFTPLCALAIFAAGRRFYSTSAGVVGALVYISIPWMVGTSSAGLVEGVSACYLFLAVYALLLSGGPIAAGQRPAHCMHPLAYLALAGLMTGAAVATKYPAVLFVLLPLGVWTFFGRLWANTGVQGPEFRVQTAGGRSENWKTSAFSARDPGPGTMNRFVAAIVALTVFLSAAAVNCGPWFAKNWVLADNPTYPLLYGIFGGKTWNADKDRQWNLAHLSREFSFELLGSDLDRVLRSGELLSPLVVPLAVFSLVGGASPRRRRLAWKLLAYASFVIAAWWLFTHRIDRFWIPILPVAAFMAGMGACWNSARWWRAILACLLLIGLTGNFLLATLGIGNDWFVPLQTLRDRIDPWHRFFNDDPAGGGVLAVGEAAVFDLKSPVFYNTCFDDCIFEQLVKGKTAREVRAELASRHIDYVFVNWDEISRYRHTYGYSDFDFVQPEVFKRLVNEGVLAPVPRNELVKEGVAATPLPQPWYPEQVYRVIQN